MNTLRNFGPHSVDESSQDAAAAISAHAQTSYTHNNTSGNWSTAADWTLTPVGGPNAAGANITKTNAGGAITTTLDVAATIGKITNTNTGSRHWTIQDDANRFALTLDNTGGTGNAVIGSSSDSSFLTVNANVIIANTDLDITSGGTASGSGATTVGVLNVNTITASPTRALNFKATYAKAITVNSSIGATGSAINIANNSTGTGSVTLNGALGANVASITQNSTTSTLFLKGVNSAFVGNTIINAGKISTTTGHTFDALSTNSISLTGSATPVAGVNYGQFIATAGTITFNGTLTLNFAGTATVGATVYDLFNTSGTGALAGSFTGISVAGSYSALLTNNSGIWSGSSVDGSTFSFNQTTGDLTVTGVAVPEPSTYALILGVVAYRRRS